MIEQEESELKLPASPMYGSNPLETLGIFQSADIDRIGKSIHCPRLPLRTRRPVRDLAPPRIYTFINSSLRQERAKVEATVWKGEEPIPGQTRFQKDSPPARTGHLTPSGSCCFQQRVIATKRPVIADLCGLTGMHKAQSYSVKTLSAGNDSSLGGCNEQAFSGTRGRRAGETDKGTTPSVSPQWNLGNSADEGEGKCESRSVLMKLAMR
jgi:hypothetical protein